MKSIACDSKTLPIGLIPPLFPIHLREKWEKGLWFIIIHQGSKNLCLKSTFCTSRYIFGILIPFLIQKYIRINMLEMAIINVEVGSEKHRVDSVSFCEYRSGKVFFSKICIYNDFDYFAE